MTAPDTVDAEPTVTSKPFWPTAITIAVIVVITVVVVARPLWERWFNELTDGPPEPVVFTSQLFGFGATYPREPTIDSHTESAPGLEIEVTTVYAETSKTSFGVSAIDSRNLAIPDPSTLSGADLDILLKSSLDGAVANVEGGTLITYDYAVVGGTRSVIADIDTAAGPATIAIVIADNEYFIVTASTTSEKDAERFIDSFELL